CCRGPSVGTCSTGAFVTVTEIGGWPGLVWPAAPWACWGGVCDCRASRTIASASIVGLCKRGRYLTTGPLGRKQESQTRAFRESGPQGCGKSPSRAFHSSARLPHGYADDPRTCASSSRTWFRRSSGGDSGSGTDRG